jgi:iron complex outermembrane receptor protein
MQPFSGFAQDEFSLLPNRLYFTIGTKVDHNHYTGFSLMPSSRLSWTPNERNMFWAAVSRAERVPAESDAATRQNTGSVPGPGGLPILAAFVGNPHVKNEGLIAYEAGYRVAISTHLSADYALYYNDYDHQDSIEPLVPVLETTPSPPHILAAATYKNLGYGETHGFEAAVNWKPSARWTLSPGYAFEQIHMHVQPSSKDTLSINEAQGASPVQSVQLRSHFEISHRLAWDASAYFVDRLSSGPVPSYTRLDTGLTWQLNQALSFSAFGQNLVKDRHLEFVDSSGILESTLVKRSMYGKLTWHF